jgi:hypothetical protein
MPQTGGRSQAATRNASEGLKAYHRTQNKHAQKVADFKKSKLGRIMP